LREDIQTPMNAKFLTLKENFHNMLSNFPEPAIKGEESISLEVVYAIIEFYKNNEFLIELITGYHTYVNNDLLCDLTERDLNLTYLHLYSLCSTVDKRLQQIAM
jgi:hypothetical protein